MDSRSALLHRRLQQHPVRGGEPGCWLTHPELETVTSPTSLTDSLAASRLLYTPVGPYVKGGVTHQHLPQQTGGLTVRLPVGKRGGSLWNMCRGSGLRL